MARSIRVDAGEYRRRGKSLFNTVASSTGWEGQDAQVFRSQMEGFEDNVEDMAELMESYAAFLDQAAKAYRSLRKRLCSRPKTFGDRRKRRWTAMQEPFVGYPE